jgi:hypothetical protein
MMPPMRAAYAVTLPLLLVAAGCSSTTTRTEVRKVEKVLETQPSQADDDDVREAEEVMEPESDPDDR